MELEWNNSKQFVNVRTLHMNSHTLSSKQVESVDISIRVVKNAEIELLRKYSIAINSR